MNLHAAQTVGEQAIRLIQLVGIPIAGALFIIGLLILLTAGKNPRRKRIGYTFTIGFGILMLLVAYIPSLSMVYMGDHLKEAHGETIQSMVNSGSGIGNTIFKGIQYATIPTVFFTFHLGVVIRLFAAKSPQRARLGVGLMIFSPFVTLVAYAIPHLITKL